MLPRETQLAYRQDTTRRSREVQRGAFSSRWRPPAPAANHAAAAPSRAAAPAMNAMMTVLLRARAILSFAFAMAVLTRRSASGGANPVRAATSRTKNVRSSSVTPEWPEDVSRTRATSARVSPISASAARAPLRSRSTSSAMIFSPATEALGPAAPAGGAANRLAADATITSNVIVSKVAKAHVSSPWTPSLYSTSSAVAPGVSRVRRVPAKYPPSP